MDTDLQPADILAARLAVLRALLGPGFLGPAWLNPDILHQPAVQTWPGMERCYGRLLRWLLPALRPVCKATCEVGSGASIGTNPVQILQDPNLSLHGAPVALLCALRNGVAVSPSGVATYCRVTAGDFLHGIVPLLAWLRLLDQMRRQDGWSVGSARQVRSLVLLAAPPGAGKSVIAALVETFSSLLSGWLDVQALGMDGWHLPNRLLRSRTMKDESGQIVSLASRKGSPESFDVKALVDDMRAIVSRDGPISVRAYDRRLHEPVPDAVLVRAPIVLLEGNYLLTGGQGWEELLDLAAGAAWIDLQPELAHESMVRRHMAVGRSQEEAEAKWASNDWPNALAAMRGRPHTGAVMYLDGARRMRFVHRMPPCGHIV